MDKMKRYLRYTRYTYLVLGVMVLGCVSEAWAEEAAREAYGRACLMVEQVAPGAGGKAAESSEFGEASEPGAGKRLALYADASRESYVLLAAFSAKERRLANDWRPQLVKVAPWQEVRLPVSPMTWSWEDGSKPFELFVIFLEAGSQALDELEKMIPSMQDPGVSPRLLDLQSIRLRETLESWMEGKDPSFYHWGKVPLAWGGILRGDETPWPKAARKVAMDDSGRGIVIYHYGLT